MDEKNSQLFFYLVGIFESSALQYMGKIKNPLTDGLEKNMEQAQLSIDMLDMIKEKMKNNLSEYEDKYLENIISMLKLNYVDESNKDKDNKSSEPKNDEATNVPNSETKDKNKTN